MKQLFFLFFSLCSIFMFSQNIRVEGHVKDTEGNPLEMANVIALNKETGGMASFSATDEKGFYKLTLTQKKTYTIRVSYLGFETQKKTYLATETDKKVLYDFVLVEKSNELGGVELTYEMPITVKGDTIVYTTDAFTTGKEKKLEDVLDKLPGVDINDEGEVEVEGKKVSKIMVEGKDFFDGDSKLATKNIPADAVKKVEVLKNYNEVSQMRGLENDEDAIALNIRLKEGKDHFWFGEITAGGGLEEHYLLHPKLFYYSPKKSLNILTDFNNIGEVPFTMRDYFKFSGGFKNLMKKGGSSIQTSSEQLGFSFLNNDRAKAITSRFAALNFNYAITDKLDFSGFAIYNDSDTDMLTETTQYYTTTDINEEKKSASLQKSQLGMLKLSSNFKPNDTFQLDYDVIFKTSKQTELMNTNSNISGLIDTYQEQIPFSVNQNLNGYFTLDEKNIFSTAVQHLYDKNAPIYNAISPNEFFIASDLLQLQAQNLFDLTQDKKQSTHKWDAKVDYFYVLNNTSNFNFTLGNTYTSQRLKSNIFQTLDDNSIYDFSSEALNNEANFTYNDLFLAFHYNLKFRKLTLTPGVSAHNFTINDRQFEDFQKQDLQRVLPDFFAQYKFKNTRSLRFEYGITTNFSDINKYAAAYLLTNYNTLLGGNRAIESSLSHSYTLRYFDFNMYNFTNVFASINYTKRVDAVKTFSDPTLVDRVSEYINMLTPDEFFLGNIRYDRRFGKLKAVASSNISFGKSYSLDNLGTNEAINFTQSYKVALSTRFKKAPNFELGHQLSSSYYTSNSRETTYVTDRPFANIEVVFLKDFIWTVDYSYSNYRNTDGSTENKYSFLSSKLYFQKTDSKWEFILSGTNLLQTASMDTNVATDYLISSSRYFVQPNYYMLTLKYNL